MKAQTLSEMDIEIENKIEKFFIQIDKSKLGDYISKGLICPDKFLGDEVVKDTQSNNNFLIISDGYIDKIDTKHLLLEIILTGNEKKLLKKIQSGVSLLDKALPITRIKTIYCQNKINDSKEIIASLLSYQSGYISEKLFKTFPKGKNKLKKYLINRIDDIEYKEYEKKFLKYDKIMGMFAFIKNTNLYYVNDRDIYSNYSDNYFDLYDCDKNEINIKKWIEDNKFYTDDVGKLFINKVYTKEYIDDTFIDDLINLINNEEIKELFLTLKSDPLEKKNILKSLENNDIYYFICLLYIYGKKGSNAKDILKDNIFEEIPFEKAENALALLGLYYGYSSLRAYEEIKIKDENYRNIQKDQNFNIKFKLDSQLDYKIVESIYKYAFNNQDEKIINDFSYLDEININFKKIILPETNEFKRWYEVKKSKKNDVLNIRIEKQNFKKIVIEKIAKYSQNIEAKYKIFSFVYEYYNELIEFEINTKKKTKKLYFERDVFIEKIKNEIDDKIQNKLLENLECDKK